MQDPLTSAVIKPEVRGLTAYTLKHFDAEVKIDQNENPYELPGELKREIVDRVLRRPWGRYPEFIPSSVIKTMSKFTGWPEEGILVGNGSNELIQASLSVTLGPGRRLAVPQPTFTLYKLMATTLQAEVNAVYLDAGLVGNDELLRCRQLGDIFFVAFHDCHPKISHPVKRTKCPANIHLRYTRDPLRSFCSPLQSEHPLGCARLGSCASLSANSTRSMASWTSCLA